MSQDYEVNGQTYTLVDGLSNEEARAKIDSYINAQSKENSETETETVTVNAEEAKETPDTYEGFLAEVGEGVVSGLINIPTGIVELGAEVYDYANDTSYAKEINETVNNWKDSVGIDPEGFAGSMAEGLVQFGVPGLGAAGLVSKVSTLGKVATRLSRGRQVGGFGKAAKYSKQSTLTMGQKVALGSQQVVAAGVADALVATDGTQTIGDFFESGPTTTDKYNVGDSGTEDAARRISNRLSMFVEGAALAGALPPVLSGLGSAFTKATTAKIPFTETSVGQTIAAPVNKITGAIGNAIKNSREKFLDQKADPTSADSLIARMSALLSPAGFLPAAKTVISKEKGVRTEFNIKSKRGDKLSVTELHPTRKTKKGEPVKTTVKFKTFDEAEEFIKNEAYSAVSKTKAYREITKKINKLSSSKDRNALDKSRIQDLRQDQKILVNEEFQSLLDNDFRIVSKEITFKTGKESVERVDLGRESSLINPLVEAYLKEAEGKFKGLEKDIDKILRKKEYVDQTDYTKEKILNTMYEFFRGNEEVTKNINLINPDFVKFGEIRLPKELLKPMKDLVDLKDGLSKNIIDSSTVQNLPQLKDFGFNGKLKRPDSFKGDPQAPGSLDEQWLELKRNQGFLIREDVINAIENSLMKSDGTTSGFMVSRYRILEDSKYQKTQTMIDDVVDMFYDEDVVRGISGTVKKDMNTHVEKVLNERLEPVRRDIAQAEREGLVPSQADTDLVAKLTYNGAGQGVKPTKDQIRSYIDIVYNNTKDKQKASMRGVGNTYRAPMQKVPMSVLHKKRVDIPTLKAIFGEIKDAREAYVSTITQMAQFKGVDNFYTLFRKIVDEDIAAKGKNSIFEDTNIKKGDANKFIKTPKGAQSYILGKSSLIKNQLDELAPGETPFGAMHGIAMPSEMWKSMSHIVMNDMNDTGRIARALYSNFLKLKGYSQYAKTILSPITQVRNVLSASAFAMAQGNVGRGANVMESLRLVKNDILQNYKGDDLAYLVDLQKRGIIGSQAELRELQSNIRRGIGYEAGIDSRTLKGKKEFTDARNTANADPSDVSRYGVKADPALVKQLKESNFNGFVGSIDKGIRKGVQKGSKVVEDMYKGGDDIWKIYNYEFELSKLRSARQKHLAKAKGDEKEAKRLAKEFDEGELKGQKIEDFAGDRVRNLVPNYDLTSPLVAGLRRLPVGNFISFPAEIIRTGFNTLDTAMKELGSNIPEIRQIGMRRLMGSLGTFVAMPIAIRDLSMKLTETSEEEMQSIQNMSAPFQKNSILLPMGRDKNGHREVIDYSHTNPYDTLIRPFTAVLRSLDKDGKLDKSAVEKIRGASYEALSTFFEPFLSESIITARLRDVMPITMYGRGGETMSGARVFKSGDGGDAFGDQLAKSFIHVIEGVTPGASPFRVPVGSNFNDIELGRFARGVGEEFGLTGSVEPSSGREYTTSGELLRAVTGLNTQSYDPKKLAGYKANEFKQNRSTAATLFNKEIRKEITTPEALLDAYQKANTARLRTFRVMRQNYLDLLRVGGSRLEIIKSFKAENLGNKEIGAIINNRYLPFFPSRDAFVDARLKNHQMPLDQIREVYKEFVGMSLDPVKEVQEESNLEIKEPVQTAHPVVNNNPVTPVKSSQVSPVARDINTRLATLLNPNDRIIAQRQGRTV